jgi:hypothetical protein
MSSIAGPATGSTSRSAGMSTPPHTRGGGGRAHPRALRDRGARGRAGAGCLPPPVRVCRAAWHGDPRVRPERRPPAGAVRSARGAPWRTGRDRRSALPRAATAPRSCASCRPGANTAPHLAPGSRAAINRRTRLLKPRSSLRPSSSGRVCRVSMCTLGVRSSRTLRAPA